MDWEMDWKRIEKWEASSDFKLKFHFLSAKHQTYERQWLKIENV
jgi:hypothetical protein